MFKTWSKEQAWTGLSLAAIIALGLALRLDDIPGNYFYCPDMALYTFWPDYYLNLIMGKTGYVWYLDDLVKPGFMVLTMGMIWLLGAEPFTLYFNSLFFASINLVLLYSLGRRMGLSRSACILAAGFMATLPVMAFTDRLGITNSFSVFLILSSLLLFISYTKTAKRWRLATAMFLITYSGLVHPTNYLLPPVFVILLLIHHIAQQNKMSLVLADLCLAVLAIAAPILAAETVYQLVVHNNPQPACGLAYSSKGSYLADMTAHDTRIWRYDPSRLMFLEFIAKRLSLKKWGWTLQAMFGLALLYSLYAAAKVVAGYLQPYLNKIPKFLVKEDDTAFDRPKSPSGFCLLAVFLIMAAILFYWSFLTRQAQSPRMLYPAGPFMALVIAYWIEKTTGYLGRFAPKAAYGLLLAAACVLIVGNSYATIKRSQDYAYVVEHKRLQPFLHEIKKMGYRNLVVYGEYLSLWWLYEMERTFSYDRYRTERMRLVSKLYRQSACPNYPELAGILKKIKPDLVIFYDVGRKMEQTESGKFFKERIKNLGYVPLKTKLPAKYRFANCLFYVPGPEKSK